MRRLFILLILFLAPRYDAYIDELRPPLENFSAYKPSYFILGQPDEKLQFSVRGQLVRSSPVFLAYTQLMRWDLFKTSAPFSDINFNPFLFYRIQHDEQIWYDFGLEHESNGKGGDDSRSWNRISALYSQTQQDFHWSFKAWYPFFYDTGNYDLPKYRGVWELEITFTDFWSSVLEKSDLTFQLNPGGTFYLNPFQGSQQLTIRTKSNYLRFLPFLMIQFFHGYAESLLQFKDEHYALRAGIGF